MTIEMLAATPFKIGEIAEAIIPGSTFKFCLSVDLVYRQRPVPF